MIKIMRRGKRWKGMKGKVVEKKKGLVEIR